MPNQSDIADTILNASCKLATLVLGDYTLTQTGHLPTQEEYISYFTLNLSALTYQYDNALYTGNTTTTLYNRLNNLIGLPQSYTVDTNFQAPNTTLIIDGSSGLPPIEFLIAAGSAWPFPYAYVESSQPDVTFLISDGSGGLTSNSSSGMFFNLVGGVMYIYGNNSGSNTFNEDTYVRIAP